MTRRIFLLALLTIMVMLTSGAFARNAITYRPFDWQKVNRGNYEVWYPKVMEYQIPATLAIIDSINESYSTLVFGKYRDHMEWYQRKYHSKQKKAVPAPKLFTASSDKAEEVKKTESDSTDLFYLFTDGKGNPDSLKFVYNWKPKKLVIVLYPSMQDYTQIKAFPGAIIPPQVLGLTETNHFRVFVPYTGEWHEYEAVLAHEIAHAWMLNFVQENQKRRDLKTRNIVPVFHNYPLWFVEGWAELLSRDYYCGNKLSLIHASLEDYTRQAVVDGRIPPLEQMGGEVYPLGYSFMRWMVDRFGIHKINELMLVTLFYNHFEPSWEYIFKESLRESEVKWREYLKERYYKDLYERSVAGKISVATDFKQSPFVGSFSYDQTSKLFVGYVPDSRQGVSIAVVNGNVPDTSKKKFLILHTQFDDKTLWYKWAKPIVRGLQVAWVVNVNGADEIHLAQIDTTDKKLKISQEQVLRSEQIVAIQNICFENDNLVVFSGVAVDGKTDLYRVTTKDAKFERLTDDLYNDRSPVPFDKGYLFVSDRQSPYGEGLYYLDMETSQIIKIFFVDGGFVGNICVDADQKSVAFRLISQFHSAQILVWNKSSGEFREVYRTFRGADFLVGFNGKNLLFTAEGVFKNDQHNNLILLNRKLLSLDLAKLDSCAIVQYEPSEIVEEGWSPKEVADFKPEKPETKLQYSGDVVGAKGATNATGEKRMGLDVGFFAAAGTPVFYNITTVYQDLSQRTEKTYILQSFQDYSWKYSPDRSKNNFMLCRDWNLWRFAYNAYYPLNFEDGLGYGYTIGHVRRIYENNVYVGSDKPDKVWTPLTGFHGYFLHDGVFGQFGGPQWGSAVVGYADINLTSSVLDGKIVVDARNYLPLGRRTRVYLANRLFMAKSFGMDRSFFEDSNPFAQRKGYEGSQFSTPGGIGTAIIIHQTELRFPLVNWVFFQPAFTPLKDNRRGIFWFTVDGSLFAEGGDVWFNEIRKFDWSGREGWAIKLRIFGAFTVKYERFKFVYRPQDLRKIRLRGYDQHRWSLDMDF